VKQPGAFPINLKDVCGPQTYGKGCADRAGSLAFRRTPADPKKPETLLCRGKKSGAVRKADRAQGMLTPCPPAKNKAAGKAIASLEEGPLTGKTMIPANWPIHLCGCGI